MPFKFSFKVKILFSPGNCNRLWISKCYWVFVASANSKIYCNLDIPDIISHVQYVNVSVRQSMKCIRARRKCGCLTELRGDGGLGGVPGAAGWPVARRPASQPRARSPLDPTATFRRLASSIRTKSTKDQSEQVLWLWFDILNIFLWACQRKFWSEVHFEVSLF